MDIERICYRYFYSLWPPQNAISRLQQFVKPTGKMGDERRYRLYHQSFIDFFKSESITKENLTLDNSYYIPPEECHKRIINCYKGSKVSWKDVDWNYVDEYGLRYFRYMPMS